MKVHTDDAEEKILNVTKSIETDPRSWQGWSILHIEGGDNLSQNQFQDAFLSVKALVESYLHDIEGSAYFCINQNIYLVCKNVSSAILNQTGTLICDLAFGEFHLPVTYRLYNLDKDAKEFSEKILGHTKEDDQTANDTQDIQEKNSPDRNTPAKVLLVEDDAVTRWMVRNSLKDECDFASAPTAHNVFSMYSSFQPDIVFLDIGLPDNSGNEVLEWIMKQDPKACVIMLSSKDNIDNISSCIEKGAKGFIPKPFVRESLLHYIKSYAA